MPEKALKNLYGKINSEWKVCFLSAMLVGFLTHFYKLTNWLPNWDSLVFRYDPQNMLGLGRWFLAVVCAPSSFYDLPFLNGMITLFFHGLGAVFICRVLDIREKITAGLIGAGIVTFPTVTSVLMYNYVSDGYSIAFFFSVLAAWYLTQEKPKYLLGALLIALATGTYQAYVTVTVMLILLKLIDKIIFGEVPFREVLKKSGHILASGILGMVLYYAVLQILLAVTGTTLSDYQGISSSTSFSVSNLFATLYVIKNTFVTCFFDLSQGLNVYVAINIVVLAVSVVYYAKYLLRNKIYRQPGTVLVGALLIFFLFIGAGALAFVNATVDYHNLMRMGYSVFYLLFVLIYERGKEHTEVLTAIKRWVVLSVAMLAIGNQVVVANVSYHKAQMAYEKSYGVLIRIADRIEETPNTADCDRILVVGALSGSEDYEVNFPPDITGITDGYIIRADDESVGQSVFTQTLNDYCGTNYEFLYGEEKKALLARFEVSAMGVFPEEGCVAVVDGILVVKLGVEG